MDIVVVNTLWCSSNAHSFEITKEFFDHVLELMYDGEGEVAYPKHVHVFLEFLGNEEEFDEIEANMFFAYTLRESPK